MFKCFDVGSVAVESF